MDIPFIHRKFVSVLLLSLVSFAFSQAAVRGEPILAPPSRMFWSWFADDDFRFLASSEAGVAYRALSLTFRGAIEVTPHPRRMRLRTAPGTYEMAVIRFDLAGHPAFSDRQRRLAVKMIEEIVKLTRVRALQIDFDAPPSAYSFYRQLLVDLRRALGSGIFLSITALVDWCDRDRSWLAWLPVNETVAMAFAMGPATNMVTARLRSGGQFAFAGCRTSIGLDRAGPFFKASRAQRVYFFSTGRWSAIGVRSAMEAVR